MRYGHDACGTLQSGTQWHLINHQAREAAVPMQTRQQLVQRAVPDELLGRHVEQLASRRLLHGRGSPSDRNIMPCC